MFFGIDLVKDRETREPHTAAAAHILGVLKQVTKYLNTKLIETSFPYFGVKLSFVCLMIAYRKKLPKVTQR